MEKKHGYVAFMLRIWLANSRSKEVWYASLENDQTGERRVFVSLEALVEYLKSQVEVIIKVNASD